MHHLKKPRFAGDDFAGRGDRPHNIGGLIGSGITSSGASGAVSAGSGLLQQGIAQSGLSGSVTNGDIGLTGASQALTNANSSQTNPFSVNNAGAGFQASPGYGFALSQAEAAQNNGAAATGNLLSGQQQIGSANVASQLANQNYYQYVGANQSGLGSYLSSALGLGSQATSAGESILGASSGLANTATNALTGAAESEGQQASAGVNGLIGGIGGLIPGLSSGSSAPFQV